MVDFRIRVVVDPSQANRGTQQIGRNLAGVERSADRVQRALQNAFAFLGVGLAIQQLVRLSDTFTELQNRLRVLNPDQRAVNGTFEQLFDISQRTRSSLQGTVELYSRLAIASRELGVDQEQLLQFTESLNQAIILSGATAQEAGAGLIQLSQGLASGTLRGDELRSVLEQLPVVADVIAQELGVTRGQLRALGEDGQITARIVTQAFASAREELEVRFARTIPTVGQALTVFNNSLIRVVGQLDQTIGFTAGLSRALIFLASNLELVSEAILFLLTLLAARLLITLPLATLALQGLSAAVTLAATGVRALTVAIAANPLGAIATAAVAAAAAIGFFGDNITVSEDELVTLRDVGQSTFELLAEAAQPAADVIASSFSRAFTEVTGLTEDLIPTLSEFYAGIGNIIAQGVNTVISLWVAAYNTVVTRWRDLPEALGDAGLLAVNALTSVIDFGITGIVQAIGDLLETIGSGFEALGRENPFENLFDDFESGLTQLVPRAGNTGLDVGRTFALEFISALEQDFVGQGLDAIFVRAREIAERRLGEFTPPPAGPASPPLPDSDEVSRLERREELLRRVNAQLANERRLLGLTNDEAAIANELFRIEEQFRRNKTPLVDAETAAIRRQLVAIQEIQNAMDLVGQAGEAVFGNLENVVTEFARTGAIDFEQFATSVIADLTRILFRALVVQPILNSLTASVGQAGGIGGLFNGLIGGGAAAGAGAGATSVPTPSFPQFQTGGFVTGPGTGTSDSLLARLSRGEFVVNSRAARENPALLQSLNAGISPQSSNGSGISVVVVDQRTVVAGEDNNDDGVQVEDTTGFNGQRELRILILDTVNRGTRNGAFDASMRGRFNLTPARLGR